MPCEEIEGLPQLDGRLVADPAGMKHGRAVCGSEPQQGGTGSRRWDHQGRGPGEPGAGLA